MHLLVKPNLASLVQCAGVLMKKTLNRRIVNAFESENVLNEMRDAQTGTKLNDERTEIMHHYRSTLKVK